MCSENQSVTIPSLNVNLSPMGFLRYASHFRDAEKAFSFNEGFSPVPYYLLGRSLELSLKAFLLAEGAKKSTLKNKLGHDLSKLARKVDEKGIGKFVSIDSARMGEIEKANKYYKDKGFEYFKPVDALRGYRDLPDIAVLRALCDEMIDKLHDHCWNAA